MTNVEKEVDFGRGLIVSNLSRKVSPILRIGSPTEHPAPICPPPDELEPPKQTVPAAHCPLKQQPDWHWAVVEALLKEKRERVQAVWKVEFSRGGKRKGESQPRARANRDVECVSRFHRLIPIPIQIESENTPNTRPRVHPHRNNGRWADKRR